MTVTARFARWAHLPLSASLCLLILFSCNPFSPVVDPVVDAFNKAIETLDNNSVAWQQTLTDLENNLISQGKTVLANQVKDLLDGSVANVGDEARCTLDFIGVRAKQQLEAIRASLPQWTGARTTPTPPSPHLCTVVPDTVHLDFVNQGGLTVVVFHGYDLQVANGVKLFVLDPRGEHEIASSEVGNPTPYQITLNVSRTNGVQFAPDAQKIRMRANGALVSDILVVAPTPAPPPRLSDLTIAFHTNDDDKDDDTGVQVQVGTVAEWHQEGKEKYPDNSDHAHTLRPAQVNLADIQGKQLRICISPNGNDTWKFNYTLTGRRDNGGNYVVSDSSITLTQDRRCYARTLP